METSGTLHESGGGAAGEAETGLIGAARMMRAEAATEGIALDGRLDETDWSKAIPVTGFTQFTPEEGAEPSQRSLVRILYGKDALYIGAELMDTEPDRIVKTLSRRDEPSLVDRFWVSIDSYLDRKTAYVFGVSAAGVQVDGILIDGRRMRGPDTGRITQAAENIDLTWDAVWNADVSHSTEGWSVEIQIPYSMLRFPETEEQTWGINLRREIARLSEIDDWVMVPRNVDGSVRHFGLLEGPKGIQTRRNVQITPYTLSRMTTLPNEAGGTDYERAINVGGDVKMGLTSNITLDATINPDFGQVEADPTELNLTTFETFFPEKRPFFTEGVQIFNFNLGIGPDGNMLYTRRIGAESPVIGATKISGRTNGGLSFGFFGATSGDKFDPERYYGVARLKKEFGTNSYIGGMMTAYDRQGTPDLAQRSYVGGLDWDLRLAENYYQIQGQTSFASVALPTTEPDETQQGFSSSLALQKLPGSLTWMASMRLYSDQFNPNDLGRLRANDLMIATTSINYLINDNQPFGPFRRASTRLFANEEWTYRERINLGYVFYVFGMAETHGYKQISLRSFGNRFGGYDVRETRGNGTYKNPGMVNLEASVSSDSRKRYTLQPGLRFSQTGSSGRLWGLDFSGSWDASSRISLLGQIKVSSENNVPAWASNEAFVLINDAWHVGLSNEPLENQVSDSYVPLDPSTNPGTILTRINLDQSAYYVPIFGDRDTRSLDVTIRSNVTFTRTLSLQLYTQVFAAKGQFDRYRVLVNPDEEVPYPAYPKSHDFAFNTLNLNLVLRWEYNPGSTLFLVWSQGRFGDYQNTFLYPESELSPYRRTTQDRFFDTFNLESTNIFMLKFSYLLQP